MSLEIDTETTIDSDPCLFAWTGDKLFVGVEDGTIKTYDAKLSPGASWSAHGSQVFALALLGENIYSASNDGGIKVWTSEGEQVTELPPTGGDVTVLQSFDKLLYAGDDAGNVVVFENNEEITRYNLSEEIKSMALNPPFLYTVRNNDVTISEIAPETSKNRLITRQMMEGSAPLRLVGPYLLFLDRPCKSLKLHDATPDTKFKKLHEIKVSDMIVTSLSTNGDYVWTGGWDGQLGRWKIADEKLEPAGELNLEAYISAIYATGPDSAYVAVTGGRIVRVKAT